MDQFAGRRCAKTATGVPVKKWTVMLKFSDRIGYEGRDRPDRAIRKSVTSARADAIRAASI